MRFFIGGLSSFILILASVMVLFGCQRPDTQPPQGHIETTARQYRISVHVPNPPLKTRKETYTLTVEDTGTNQSVTTDSLAAKVTMTMPDHAMEAPSTVKKLSEPGHFEITTEFTMPGEWTLEVKPVPSAEPIPLKLAVEADE
jgi:hypothetical protein